MSEIIFDLEAQSPSVVVTGGVVRCRACAHCKPTTDGRRYCSLWSHIVPPEGYCWCGEEADHAEA